MPSLRALTLVALLSGCASGEPSKITIGSSEVEPTEIGLGELMFTPRNSKRKLFDDANRMTLLIMHRLVLDRVRYGADGSVSRPDAIEHFVEAAPNSSFASREVADVVFSVRCARGTAFLRLGVGPGLKLKATSPIVLFEEKMRGTCARYDWDDLVRAMKFMARRNT